MNSWGTQRFASMTLIDQQQHIAFTAFASAVSIVVLKLIKIFAGIKFPATGPNELLIFDSFLSGAICYICFRKALQRHVGKMIAITMVRLFCLIFLGVSIYAVPEWFLFKAHFFDYLMCWIVLSIHIVFTSANITMVITLFCAEEVMLDRSYRSFREFFRRKRNRMQPPEYEEAISSSAQPPSYEEAIASCPPGYIPTATPLVQSSTYSPIQISEHSVRFDRELSDAEESETTF